MSEPLSKRAFFDSGKSLGLIPSDLSFEAWEAFISLHKAMNKDKEPMQTTTEKDDVMDKYSKCWDEVSPQAAVYFLFTHLFLEVCEIRKLLAKKFECPRYLGLEK